MPRQSEWSRKQAEYAQHPSFAKKDYNLLVSRGKKLAECNRKIVTLRRELRQAKKAKK